MEQLAIFALPKSYDDVEDQASGSKVVFDDQSRDLDLPVSLPGSMEERSSSSTSALETDSVEHQHASIPYASSVLNLKITPGKFREKIKTLRAHMILNNREDEIDGAEHEASGDDAAMLALPGSSVESDVAGRNQHDEGQFLPDTIPTNESHDMAHAPQRSLAMLSQSDRIGLQLPPSKLKAIKKPDGFPFWRKEIQYDALHSLFSNKDRNFTSVFDGSKGHTFAEIYIEAISRRSSALSNLDHERLVKKCILLFLVNIGKVNKSMTCKANIYSSDGNKD